MTLPFCERHNQSNIFLLDISIFGDLLSSNMTGSQCAAMLVIGISITRVSGI